MKIQDFLLTDDDWVILEGLKRILVRAGHRVLATCLNTDDARRVLLDDRPDYVICDVYYGGEPLGIPFCRELDQQQIPYFLLTGNDPDDILPQLDRMQPVGMILKPLLERDILTRINLHTVTSKNHTEKVLEFTYKHRKYRIDKFSIHYIESDGAYCILHTAKQRYALVSSLHKLARRLQPEPFIRIHRSYIINRRYLKSYSRTSIYLVTPVTLPIGRSYLADFRRWMHT